MKRSRRLRARRLMKRSRRQRARRLIKRSRRLRARRRLPLPPRRRLNPREKLRRRGPRPRRMNARKSMVAARLPRRTPRRRPRRRSVMDRRRQSRPRLGRRPQPRMLRPLRRSTAPRLHPRALRPPRRRAPRLLPRMLRPPRRRRRSRIARWKTASKFAGKAMRKRAAPDGSACFRVGAAPLIAPFRFDEWMARVARLSCAGSRRASDRGTPPRTPCRAPSIRDRSQGADRRPPPATARRPWRARMTRRTSKASRH